MLRSDEMKINRIVGDGKIFLRRPNNQEFNPRSVVKHGGGSIMMWVCFDWNGIGQFIKFMEFYISKNTFQF